tara:strand:+ start:1226 stop:1486 length:261 start_codon:yes stop_codon:yes gene_type:complete
METKKWYQSRTIWGIVIAFVGFALNKYLGVDGLELPKSTDYDQLTKQVEAIKDAQGNIMNLFSQVMAAFGALLALIGRVKAETKIV